MLDLKVLEKKIIELDERLKKIEDKDNRMDELYKKAEELVVKSNKASVIFLQRKLWIDFDRATELIEKLQTNGVVGPALGFEPRKVLVKNQKNSVQ